MSQNFDNFPVYDPLVKQGTNKMADVWVSFVATFVETLQGYLTQYGVFLPPVTIAQRNAIQAPVEGQTIYVTDATVGPPRTGEAQIWQVKAGTGAWRTFTTTP